MAVRRLRVGGEHGQALVETAIVLPVVVLLLFGMLDAGRLFHAWIVATNAAREGARVAAAGHDEAAVLAHVDAAMAGVDTYEVAAENVGGESGSAASVSVAAEVTMLTPLIGAIIGNPVTVESASVMRLE